MARLTCRAGRKNENPPGESGVREWGVGRASRNLSPGRILFDWLTLGKEPFRSPWRLAKRFADNKLRGTFPPKSAELSKKHGKSAFRPGQAPTPTAAGGRLCLQPQQLRSPQDPMACGLRGCRKLWGAALAAKATLACVCVVRLCPAEGPSYSEPSSGDAQACAIEQVPDMQACSILRTFGNPICS